MNLLVSVSIAAGSIVAGSIVAAPSTAVARETGPLDTARRAAEQVSFHGSVEVQWRDGGATRREHLTIENTSGTILVRGGTSVMANPGHERLIRHGAQWDLLWPPSLEAHSRPDSSLKYTTVPSGQATVAGRRTDAVEVRQGERVRERLYLDTDTGLLLRRDRFDAAGGTDQRVELTALTIGAPAHPAERPVHTIDQAPRPVPAARQPTNALAPAALPDGYRRLGVYRQTGALHLLYSDGLYDLSLFEQPGRLVRADLPGGGREVRVGRSAGRMYSWPGGHVVIWQVGPNVLTMVSDAPVDQLLHAADSVRGPNPSPSLLTRLRQAARALVAPLSE